MTERQKIDSLRTLAERLRSKPEAAGNIMFEDTDGNALWTVEEFPDACDDLADRIEAGEDDEESPEQLMAEAEVAKEVVELLRRRDAGSLEALRKRKS